MSKSNNKPPKGQKIFNVLSSTRERKQTLPKSIGQKIHFGIELCGKHPFATSVVQKRAEWKDYVDLVTLIDAGITLPMALSAGKAIYKNQFNPQITLKSLSYFDDIKGITPQIKKVLQDAVRSVDLQSLPSLKSINLAMLELNL